MVRFILLVIFLCTPPIWADDVFVEGYVISQETQQAIEGVNIRGEEPALGTVTDKRGRFVLSLPVGKYVLRFSRVGYQTLYYDLTVSDASSSKHYISLRPQAIEMDVLDVEAQKVSSEHDDIQDKTGVLSGDELQKKYSLTLAETMKNEMGVAIRSMGPAPARPVIRGLGGDRVQINQDGIKAHDLSATSADHAVTLEPFNVERIEVIRGPRTLLYSSTAIGGVVNVVKNKIPDTHPQQVFGTVGSYAETSNRGFLTSAAVTVPVGRVGVYGETSYRNTQNVQTPIGTLYNTPITTHTYVLGLSYVTPKGYVGASFDQFETDYGIPGGFIGGHPNGVDLDIVRRVFDGKAVYHFDSGLLNRLETQFSKSFYHHFEFESNGSIGSEFLFHDYNAQTNLYLNTQEKTRNTVVSLGFEHRNLKLGGFVFTPPTRQLSLSAGLYHEWAWSQVEWQAALRYAYAHFDPRPNANTNIGQDVDRKFHTWSASVSPILPITDQLSVGVNLSRSERAPTIEELYNEGPHLAAYTFEIGRVDLDTEQSFGFEVFGHLKSDDFDWVVTGFWNEFDNFITPRNTGEINFAQLLPIYKAEGIAARFLGLETHVGWRPTPVLSLEMNGSYVHGQNRDDDVPLPEMPPLKVAGEVAFRVSGFTLGVTGEWVSEQNRVDTFEAPTQGYVIGGGFLQRDFVTAHTRHNIVLSVDNVFNREYRNHLSRIRSVMPEAGRNVRLNYKVYFF